MRAVAPRARRGVRRRRAPRTALDVVRHRPGLHGRALLRLRCARHAPARCSPRATTRRKYNGIKLCRAGAAPVGQDSGPGDHRGRGRSSRACPPDDGPAAAPSSSRDMLADYATYLRALVDLPRSGRSRSSSTPATAWAGFTVPACSAPARRSTSCRCTSSSTARSPTTRPTRSIRRTSSTCRRGRRASGADIGLAFDGDADRCFVVDEHGEPVCPSAITALVALRELAKAPGRRRSSTT